MFAKEPKYTQFRSLKIVPFLNSDYIVKYSLGGILALRIANVMNLLRMHYNLLVAATTMAFN